MNVEGYGHGCSVFLESSGNSDDKVRVKAADKDGVVFYSSHVLTGCPPEDYNAAQLVAMAALEHWDSTMSIGPGSYANQELEADWPASSSGWD